MRIFHMPRKSAAIAAGASASWLASIGRAVALAPTVTGTLLKPQLVRGVGLQQAPTTATVPVTPARSLVATVEGSAQPTITRGVELRSRLDVAPAVTLGRGVELTQTKIDLLGTYGPASNTVVAGTAWTNPNNANGVKDGAVATSAGAVSGASRHIGLAFPAVTGKSALTLTKVELRFYASISGIIAGNGFLQFYSGYAGTILGTFTVDTNALASGVTYDITSAYSTWASLEAGVLASVLHTYGAATLAQSASLDSVELIVTATRTDAL